MKNEQDNRNIFSYEEARDYNEVAGTFFAPAFPYIVTRIIKQCGIVNGLALDLGSGPAHLAIETARQTELRLIALDISEHILHFARKNIARAGFSHRITPLIANTKELPVKDRSVDLVISRGSLFAWDLEHAFREINRVLRPGGKAFVGLGLGSREIHEEINHMMNERGRRKKDHPAGKFMNEQKRIFPELLVKLGIHRYEVSNDDSGFWIYLEKEED